MRELSQRLDVSRSRSRTEMLLVLMLPDFEGGELIGRFWSYQQSRAFAEVLIEREDDRTLR